MKTHRPELPVLGASRTQGTIALLSLAAIALYLMLRFTIPTTASIHGFSPAKIPLIICLVFGGGPLVLGLLAKLFRREFGSDLLAGISIVTSVLLGEYLAGALVVLMLSGGAALEAYAVRSASSVLEALAKRMPLHAHRKQGGTLADFPLDGVAVGGELVADWAGNIQDVAPERLDAIIDTTPAWAPIIAALGNLAPGGRLVINAIRKEDADKGVLSRLDYPTHLWREKELKSVANVTRRDVAEFLRLAAEVPIRPEVREYAMEEAHHVLVELNE